MQEQVEAVGKSYITRILMISLHQLLIERIKEEYDTEFYNSEYLTTDITIYCVTSNVRQGVNHRI
ncbi:MAG: hypothetical protein V8Q58_01215 [Anaerobutyricum hallii]|uniref:hypothetical protein n=1 Tax=Anaerobutyricum hallii TaxID=39488 RepID=UPI00300EDB3F